MSEHYTLWGQREDHASGCPIAITAGSMAECRRERRFRQDVQGGWLLAIGVTNHPRPWFPGDPA